MHYATSKLRFNKKFNSIVSEDKFKSMVQNNDITYVDNELRKLFNISRPVLDIIFLIMLLQAVISMIDLFTDLL